MKIEVVITVWDDDLFKMRDRIESNDIDDLLEQFDVAIDNIQNKLNEQDAKKYTIGDDDDIPF